MNNEPNLIPSRHAFFTLIPRGVNRGIYNSLKIKIFAVLQFAEFVFPVEYQSTVQGVLRSIELINHFFSLSICQSVRISVRPSAIQSIRHYENLLVCQSISYSVIYRQLGS
jgi:hypothetical protein